jgi:branched-chain amino acid transport system permease protein
MRLNHVGGPDMAPHTPLRSEAPRGTRGAPRSPFRRQTIAAVLIVVLALLLSLPLVGGDYYVYIFALMFTNVILAASLRPSLTCGQLNIGHSAFMCVGAYTSALLAKNLGVPFEVSLLGGALLAAAVGLAIGYPSLRLRGVYFAMVTVAFVEATRLIASIWVPLTRGNAGLSGVPKPSVLGMTLATKTSQYYLALFLMLVVLLILYKLEQSRLGLVWKSIGMADNLAQSLGVNIAHYKLLAFTLGCFFAGVAGAFYAHFIRFLFPPEFGFLLATNILVYNFVGGRGHFVGPIVGAVFLSLLSEPFRGSPYETIFFSLAMLLTILFLPGGLITLPGKLAGLRVWKAASAHRPSPAA